MFRELLARFTHPTPHVTPLPPADARHALGALLVRVAKADHAYLFQEIEQIDHILQGLYDLNPLEAAKMRASCEKLEEQMPETAELGHIIRDGIDRAETAAMVMALWRVVEADGQRHDSEVHVVALATEAFGMSPEDAVALREQATSQK